MLSLSQRRLVEENINLAYHAACHYLARYPRLESMRDDLKQEALLGLTMAAAKYKPSAGKFSTYAWYWAYARIREYARAAINPVSGAPGTQRGGKQAVYVPRESFEDWMLGAANENYDTLDAAEVATRFRSELVDLMRTRTLAKNPERDVGVFLSPITGDISDEQEAMSKQRIEQVRRRVRPLFADLAADYQQEAA